MKKVLSLGLVLAMAITAFAACAPATPSPSKSAVVSTAPSASIPSTATETSDPAASVASSTQPTAAGDIYIPLVSKGFQHKFWQTVKTGADEAAAKYGVKINFQGPASESEISQQVEMLKSEMSKNPSAIALAALDTESVMELLNEAKAKNIPVIGFDSGIPNAPEGTIVTTASTDNVAAGALGAQKLFEQTDVAAAIKAATKDAPAVLVCFSQDATSGSVTGRTEGFVNKMKELCEVSFPDGVAVTGHDKYAAPSKGDKIVEINVVVPPTTGPSDMQAAAQQILSTPNLKGIFCSNEASVGGVLSASADGKDLNKETGKYKDIVVVGFDSGEVQLNAVRNSWIYGSVTQDPYQIGYKAVELAVKAINGEKLELVVDTGCQFYTKDNMEDKDISVLLYD